MGRSGRSGGSRSGGSRSRSSSRSSGSSSRSSGRSGRSLYSSGLYGSSSHYSGSHHYYGGGYNRRSTGPFSVVVIIVIYMVISAAVSVFQYIPQSVPSSTVKREPLPSGICQVSSSWYKDDLNWITSSGTLQNGLKHFYNKTGIQPIIYITDKLYGEQVTVGSGFDDKLSQYADYLYEQWFDDEGHLLLVFFEQEGSYDPHFAWTVGSSAASVMDEEALDIMVSYIWSNYDNTSLDEAQMFSNAFKQTANRIMNVTKPWYFYPAIGLVILFILVIVFTWWKKVKAQKNLEMEQTQKILETPLDSFGVSQTDLEDKYRDE